jgi:hypothetical protein
MHWFPVGGVDNGRKKLEIPFNALSIETIGFWHGALAHKNLSCSLDPAFGDQIARKEFPIGGGVTLLSVVAGSTNWKARLKIRGAARPLTS